jgi:hypothetical protein
VFLDFNPKHFGRVLDYLRAKRISTLPGIPAPLPTVDPGEIQSFKHLVQRLGLFDEIFPIIKESFNPNHAAIDVKENGTKLTVLPNSINNTHNLIYTIGEHVYDSGVFRLKAELYCNNDLDNRCGNQNDVGVDIGFINHNIQNFSSSNGNTRPCFIGWNLGRNQISTHGKRSGYLGWSGASGERYTWGHGDVIELLLDMDGANLFLNAPDGQQFHVELPKWTKLRLCVGLKNPNIGLHIVEVRKEG